MRVCHLMKDNNSERTLCGLAVADVCWATPHTKSGDCKNCSKALKNNMNIKDLIFDKLFDFSSQILHWDDLTIKYNENYECEGEDFFIIVEGKKYVIDIKEVSK